MTVPEPTYQRVNALTHTVRDATLGQVVRRQLHRYLVTPKDSNVVLAHLAGDMSGHHVTVLKLHPELGVGKGFKNRAFHFYVVFFSQELLQRVCCNVSRGGYLRRNHAVSLYGRKP